jgi:two-component system response regulator HydG
MSTLVVVAASDSFSRVWPELAGEAGARLLLAEGPAAAGAARDALGVVLAVAGCEDAAEELLAGVAAAIPAPCAVVGAGTDHRLAVRAVQAGAADYFALPGDLALLRAWVADRARRAAECEAAADLAAAERRAYDFGRIVGDSPALHAALETAASIIPHGRATVLITGETGTGKELLAHAIHFNGPRAAAPFVELNCAAVPAGLLESELFGYERGAFTDAHAAKPGLFEAADGGTLFLDEVAELPLELQGKVLRVLEEKRVRRLGSVRATGVDVRIIAATHQDLAAAVARRAFREDLYYRLNVIPIRLPALRERGGDVLLLAEHFLRRLAAEYGVPVPALDAEVRAALPAHAWPGNVRELRNSMERALLLGGGAVRLRHVFPAGAPVPGAPPAFPFPAPLHEIERAAARAMMELLEGNKRAAADALGISRTRLYRLLEPEGVAQ